VHIWDQMVSGEDASILEARMREYPLFVEIAGTPSLHSESLTKCLYWIVSLDFESQRDIQAKQKATPGTIPEDFSDGAKKLESLASKAERHTKALLPLGRVAIGQIRSHAKQLRAIAKYRTLMASGRARWRRKNSSSALCFLVQTATEKTGRPNFQKLADLLTAVSYVLEIRAGNPSSGDEVNRERLTHSYTAEAIKMRTHRRRSKTAS
jgi:hypothetical protein